MPSKIIIKNCKALLQVELSEIHRRKICGKEMKNLSKIEDAYIAIENGFIVDYGKMEDWPGINDWSDLEVIDATNKYVMPCFADSHTHLVYAGNRILEYSDRIKGISYQEIAAKGGGILNSAKLLANTSEDDLFFSAKQRLEEVILQGTGSIEIKSGYGLSTESELKILRVIKRLKEVSPIPIKTTFLGAHAVPANTSKEEYIKEIIDVMIPAIAKENLADYCDVFCEENYFTKEETIAILNVGKKHGLTPKVHANQLSFNGGVQAGVEVGAISVDHLEYVGADEINCLLNSETIPTVLPGAQFFINLPHPPMRKMIDAGLAVAIASDYNPGSSPSGNMQWMIGYACVAYKITPEEAINAATLNSAYAMDLAESTGSIGVGKLGNLIITNDLHNYAAITYNFGSDFIDTLIINNRIIKKRLDFSI